MAASVASVTKPAERGSGGQDVGFAVGIVFILTVLFLPLPAILIDLGLAFSIALSVLILMVALWIQKPLDFSAFPTVLLIATMLRLSLNIATTRLILSHGAEGYAAAGHVIAGFASFVMSGDFVIGTIVFVILITVNFVVITKGATRIAEVGARFTLDAIPGKQMAIDADLNSGLIDDKEATRRRRELEEESAFFGSMDGASKFVRGDAIAGLIITAVNIFGGIVIGVDPPRHVAGSGRRRLHQTLRGRWPRHADPGPDRVARRRPAGVEGRHARLDGKGSVRPARQLPASLATRWHRRCSSWRWRRGCRSFPSPCWAALLAFTAYIIPKRRAEVRAAEEAKARAVAVAAEEETRLSVKELLRTTEIELCLGKQISGALLKVHGELAQRVGKMRRNFASQYGFVVPEIKLTDDLGIAPKSYQIKVHGTMVASEELRIGDVLVITGEGARPDVPGEEAREPAFGIKAMWVPETFAESLKREGFKPVDNMSVLLTHLREVIRNNLAQLLSYKDMRALLDRLEPEYRRLIDEIMPSQISYLRHPGGAQAAAGRACFHPQPPPGAGGHRRDRAARAPRRAAGRARAHAAGAADLRRPCRERCAQGAAPRQPLGLGLPPEPQA